MTKHTEPTVSRFAGVSYPAKPAPKKSKRKAKKEEAEDE